MKPFRRSLLFTFVSLLMTVWIGKNLRWDHSPGFMYQESYGLAYNFAVSLGDLCDPNPLAGLEGQTSNVTDQRCFSLLYSIPSKLLKDSVDLYTLHRVIGVVLVFLALFFLSMLLCKMALPSTIIFAVLIYYGLSTQFISYLYEAKLTLSSVTWLTFMLCSFVFLERAASEKRKSALAILFLYPLVIVLGYETYAVSRPLAVVMLPFTALWILVGKSWRSRRKIAAFVFLVGFGVSIAGLKGVHPQMVLDWRIFEGRTESLISPSGTMLDNPLPVMEERFGELAHIFDWSPLYFSSESPGECGWREVLIVAGIGLIGLLLAIAVKGMPTLQTPWTVAAIVLVTITALGIPLCSTTYLRGHRLFGFYLGSTIVTALIWYFAAQKSPRFLKYLISFGAVAVGVFQIWRMAPLLRDWTPEPRFTPPYSWDLIHTLEAMPVPPNYEASAKSVPIYICDKKTPPDWEHLWNAALYVSDFGCRVSGQRTIPDDPCTCLETSFEESQQTFMCLIRSIRDEKNFIHLRYRLSGGPIQDFEFTR